MIFHYFKRHWDEPTGEAITGRWGLSVFYFETDDTMHVVRQMQLFTNGNLLKYDTDYTDDKFGSIALVPLDAEEFASYAITKEEFEQYWQNSYYKKFPEIVCTTDTLWGQPRLEGRRLAVGDIVSLAASYTQDLSITLNDFELTLQQVRQALHYCKSLQCKIDKPEKFCHNCLLRTEQEGELPDKEDAEQPYWKIAEKLFEKYFKRAA